MTFGAQKLSEPFSGLQVRNLTTAVSVIDIWKFFKQMHIFVHGPKLLQWNFIQMSQLPIRSGMH